jgi:hypothetical protein
VTKPGAIGLASIVVVTDGVISADLGHEKALLSMHDGVYYGLNPVGADIWELISEARRVQEIRDAIVARYDVDPERCERDVLNVLAEFLRSGLIEVRSVDS